ncbi:MAG TPA: lytic murein transglycosylase [Jiangellaceae bacterium]|nr:lytic murein transglycosylase [Jiangellaceae bacterium]
MRGIPLDGRPNVALIRDTDGGALDGDTTYDRAVGPMQFIPSTWRSVAADANADGRHDPNNIYDAAEGAAVYLRIGNADLRDPSQAARAVRRYNNADEYVRVVLSLAELYETGGVEVVPSSPVPGPEDRSTRENPSALPAAPRPSTSPAPAATSAPVETAPAPAPTEATAAEPSATPRPEETVPAQPSQPEETVPARPPQPEEIVSGEPTPPEEAMSVEPTPPVEQAPTAAVGWAPAMREVVLTVVEETPVLPGPTPRPVPGPGS